MAAEGAQGYGTSFGGLPLRTGFIVDSNGLINIDDDGRADADGDGLSLYQELILFGTDPQTADPSNLQYLSYSNNGNSVTITDCDTAASGELVIPDTIEGKPVNSIGLEAFKDLSLIHI